MRRLSGFNCHGAWCAATLDTGERTTGLLIVSGGNEIRSGAHAGQAALAAYVAALGHPVFRYDRRGIGDSEGENQGFEESADDIAAAISAFREEAPHIEGILAFGNCDAASALALFHEGLGISHLLLANPWTIEQAANQQAPTPPNAAAIRARYWQRLKNPRSLLDLLSGKVNLAKLAKGLRRAASRDLPTDLAARIGAALAESDVPVTILLAQGDTTARAFQAEWDGPAFAEARKRKAIELRNLDSASHSFADETARNWLYRQIAEALEAS